MHSEPNRSRRSERGPSLMELGIGLAALSLGLLAAAKLFAAEPPSFAEDRIQGAANYLAQEQIEQFVERDWDDPALAVGVHPASGAAERIGGLERSYRVVALDPPFLRCKRITVTVRWFDRSPHSVEATSYIRR